MWNRKGVHLIIFCVTFQFVKDATAESLWKKLLAPADPSLFRVRSYNETTVLNRYSAVLDFIGLVAQFSYPAEEHNVTTEDGYNLVIHRIPSSPNAKTTTNNKVVYLQHGILASSDSWVIMGPGKDLAFLLSDLGYDVWVGNVRGNSYCRSHQTLTTADKKFWDFSFHEHGYYDLRASIDYVLKHTGKKSLTYVGHSMGTTMSYVLLSLRPEYNRKMNLVVSLAPVALWNHGLTKVFQRIVEYRDYMREFFDSNEIYDVAAQSTRSVILSKILCSDLSPLQPICSTLLFVFTGFDSDQMNKVAISRYMNHFPAGVGLKVIYHYIQNMRAVKFQRYDYGSSENRLRYKKNVPPLYDLKKITAPVALFYAQNDGLLKPDNAKELTKHLTNIVLLKEVPFHLFNHLDFLLATDARTLLHNYVIDVMKKY